MLFDDGKWYPSRIDDISISEAPSDQESCLRYSVTYLEYGTPSGQYIPESKIRSYRHAQPEELKPDAAIRAIYSGDSFFYDAVIINVVDEKEAFYSVKFADYEEFRIVPIADLRLARLFKPKKRGPNAPDVSTPVPGQPLAPVPEKPVIPDHLKVRPSDTDDEKQAKLKKIKRIKSKHHFQKVKIEQDTKKSA